MLEQNIPIPPRLKTIYDIIPDCQCFADIGTDHAYLPVYLCASGRAKTAIASDIVKGPLERARATIDKYNMQEKISVRLGPGLSTIEQGEADVVSIAGMGGLIIAQILADGREVLKYTKKIILQPMTAVPELREFLLSNGWSIDEEYLTKDSGKLYNILSVSISDVNCKAENIELFLGKYLIENKPDLYGEYLDRKIFKLKKMIDGLSRSSSNASKEKLIEHRKLLSQITKLKEDMDNV